MTAFRAPFALRVSRTFVFDLFTSYGVALARAAAMFAIVALLSRRTTTGHLAVFLFLRSLLGFLTNLFAGAQPAAMAALRLSDPTVSAGSEWSALLLANVLPSALFAAVIAACAQLLKNETLPMLGLGSTTLVGGFILTFTLGTLGRVASDAAGGVLQLRKHLWLDNLLVAGGEAVWVLWSLRRWSGEPATIFADVGTAYAISGTLVFASRWACASVRLDYWSRWRDGFRADVLLRFLSVAGLLTVASLGDFLFVPTNNLIISRRLDPLLVAAYGSAIQVDALLLLAVAGISSIILPRVAVLYEAGDLLAIRRAFVAGTLCSILLLAGGAGLFLTFLNPMLRLWLGEAPPAVRAILPFVLMHTVLGGSAGVGRAVLMGIGRFRAWTFVSIGSGLIHASLAYTFAVTLGFGLRGIVCATILVVTTRNLIWMPWYVLRCLGSPMSVNAVRPKSESALPPA